MLPLALCGVVQRIPKEISIRGDAQGTEPLVLSMYTDSRVWCTDGVKHLAELLPPL